MTITELDALEQADCEIIAVPLARSCLSIFWICM